MAKEPSAAFLKNWLRKYVFAPRYPREQRLWLRSADGLRLCAHRVPAAGTAIGTVVLVHGFVNWSRTPGIHRFAQELSARNLNVIAPELRGHGRSQGRSQMGLDEALDVDAAVKAAPESLPVITVGVSLGGAAAILQAGTIGGVAAVVAVSAPASWAGEGLGEGSARVGRYINTPLGRAILAVFLRTRVAKECGQVPAAADSVAAIAPARTVIAHDPKDWYFGPEHATRLYEWAKDPKDLWWYDGAGHGVDLLTPEFADRVAELFTRRAVEVPKSAEFLKSAEFPKSSVPSAD